MHPDADAFLDAIFDAPEDDTPRLVYADWLQEHGQENYAQFIRSQCAAAREKLWSAEANRLWEEIGRVWTRLDEEWRPATRDGWGQPARTNLDAIHFERGFLLSHAMSCGQLVRYGETCWPWLPFPVTALRQTYDPIPASLPILPRLARIQHLQLAGLFAEHDLWLLIESPHLSQLRVLDLSSTPISSDEVERLLLPGRYRHLREIRLRVLDLKHDRPDPAGCLTADVDASSLHLAQLRRQLEARFEKVVWHVGP